MALHEKIKHIKESIPSRTDTITTQLSQTLLSDKSAPINTHPEMNDRTVITMQKAISQVCLPFDY